MIKRSTLWIPTILAKKLTWHDQLVYYYPNSIITFASFLRVNDKFQGDLVSYLFEDASWLQVFRRASTFIKLWVSTQQWTASLFLVYLYFFFLLSSDYTESVSNLEEPFYKSLITLYGIGRTPDFSNFPHSSIVIHSLDFLFLDRLIRHFFITLDQ